MTHPPDCPRCHGTGYVTFDEPSYGGTITETCHHKREEPPLTWTDTPPTVPGVFLHRQRGETRPERWEIVVTVPDKRLGTVVRKLSYPCGGWGHSWPLPAGQFAGPLPAVAEADRTGDSR